MMICVYGVSGRSRDFPSGDSPSAWLECERLGISSVMGLERSTDLARFDAAACGSIRFGFLELTDWKVNRLGSGRFRTWAASVDVRGLTRPGSCSFVNLGLGRADPLGCGSCALLG
ncbi:hypothetical protein LIER_21894 [Lithospermum erythrorhizon]|uniref:Uncharacterized protein n=1 Tax=Lithospermum erythrorhizon TaxID=34254 RepID=A0AAV3QUU8_LITER